MTQKDITFLAAKLTDWTKLLKPIKPTKPNQTNKEKKKSTPPKKTPTNQKKANTKTFPLTSTESLMFTAAV